MKKLDLISIGLTVLGLGVSFASGIVNDKKQDALIDKKVTEKLAELSQNK